MPSEKARVAKLRATESLTSEAESFAEWKEALDKLPAGSHSFVAVLAARPRLGKGFLEEFEDEFSDEEAGLLQQIAGEGRELGTEEQLEELWEHHVAEREGRRSASEHTDPLSSVFSTPLLNIKGKKFQLRVLGGVSPDQLEVDFTKSASGMVHLSQLLMKWTSNGLKEIDELGLDVRQFADSEEIISELKQLEECIGSLRNLLDGQAR